MIKFIATKLSSKGSDSLLSGHVYGFVKTGAINADNSVSAPIEWYSSEMKGKAANDPTNPSGGQKMELDYVKLVGTTTTFIDHGDKTYTLNTISTTGLEETMRIVISGVEYMVYDIVTDTSFKIEAYTTGLDFATKNYHSRTPLTSVYHVTIDPDKEETGTIKFYRSALADITQLIIDEMVSDGFGTGGDYEII